MSKTKKNGRKTTRVGITGKVLNINEGFNKKLKEACRTLKEYRQYVDKVRAFAKDKSRGEAYEGNR